METILMALFIMGCGGNSENFDRPEDIESGGFEILEPTAEYAIFLGCLPGLGATCRGFWQWADSEYWFWIKGNCAGKEYGYGEKWDVYYLDEVEIYANGETFATIIFEDQRGTPQYEFAGKFLRDPYPVDSPAWNWVDDKVYSVLNAEFSATEFSSGFYGYRFNPAHQQEPELSCE